MTTPHQAIQNALEYFINGPHICIKIFAQEEEKSLDYNKLKSKPEW